ncbi:MAG TPA: hypothetical protein VHH11_16615 [Gammaproteobacteria bacterium]|nr:hypothetical protein [Gammaproteobacteria bacterium]
MRTLTAALWIGSVALGGCTAEGLYEPQYLEKVAPPYLAENKVVVLMHDHDLQYTFTGKPVSEIGENVTLTMPIGEILREVARNTFRSYFMYGVVFTDKLVPDLRYTVAIEPELRNFAFRYDRQTQGDVFDVLPGPNGDGRVAEPVSTITPSIRFDLDLTVYDADDKVLLKKTYESGWVAGESYIVTSRPHERVNATFHKALQAVMERVADDIRPFFAMDEVEG